MTIKQPHSCVKTLSTLLVFAAVLLSFCAQALQVETPFTAVKRFNKVGQITGVINPRPAPGQLFPVTRNTYDPATGLLTKVETGTIATFQNETIEPKNWETYTTYKALSAQVITYDNLGRKKSEQTLSVLTSTAPVAEVSPVTEYSYDGYNRLVCTAQRLGGAVTGNACVAGVDTSGKYDRVTQSNYYDYDSNDPAAFSAHVGKVKEVIRGVGSPDQQVYVKYVYSGGGQLVDETDANGNLTHLDYYTDSGRLKTIYFPVKNTVGTGTYSLTDRESYEYDLNGNRTKLTKRDGVTTITYAFDALNREKLKTISTDASKNVQTTYDLFSLKKSTLFVASGKGITTVFNGFGQLASETTNVSGTSYTVSNTYDNNGNRETVKYPDNKVFYYSYNGLDLPVNIKEDSSSGLTLITNTYDEFARPATQATLGGVSTSLTYDSVTRVKTVSLNPTGTVFDLNYAFKYNPVNQMLEKNFSNDNYQSKEKGSKTGTYAVNGLNQYKSVGAKSYAYDSNSNMTSDGDTTYTYDAENRLISATGLRNATLSYDPLGRLYQIANGQATYFMYSGDSMIGEYQNGVMNRRYVFGTGVDKPLVSYIVNQAVADNKQFLHSNYQGSIIAATNSTGNVISVNTYDAYGVPGTDNQGRFAYTGQTYLAELGMYYYKARIYAPGIGRFLQTDPIGYKDNMNLYAYTGNDPINNTDPTGLKNCPDGSTNCTETPESADKPNEGEPPPRKPEVDKVEEVVVTGHRKRDAGMRFNVSDEMFFTADEDGLTRRKLEQHDKKCNGRIMTVGTFKGGLGAGQAAAHTHSNSHDQIPGPMDGGAARQSTTGAAFMMTKSRVFTIEAMSNGTFRTVVAAGSPLTSAESSALVANMQNWENPPPGNAGGCN